MLLLWIGAAFGADDCVFDQDRVWRGVVEAVRRSDDADDVHLGDHRLDLRLPDGTFVVLAVRGCRHLGVQATLLVPNPWSEHPTDPSGPWFTRAARVARFLPGHLDPALLEAWVTAPPVPTRRGTAAVYVGGDPTWPHTVAITPSPGVTLVHLYREYD